MAEKKRVILIITVLFIILTSVLAFSYYSFLNLNNTFKKVEKNFEYKNKINICKSKLYNLENQLLREKFLGNQNIIRDSTFLMSVKEVVDNTQNSDKTPYIRELLQESKEFNKMIENGADTLNHYKINLLKSNINLKLGNLEIAENESLNNNQKKVTETLQLTTWIAIISFFVTFFVLVVGLNLLLSNIEDKQNQIHILERINHQKNNFFSIIGHDLKTPLGSFITLTEVLESNTENIQKEDFTVYLNMMKKSANNIFKLLDNLLQWTRLQMNYVNYTPSVIELNKVINHSVLQFDGMINEKNINIIKSYESDFNIEADIWMLETILRNIIQNAIKYSYKGSDVKIITKKVKNKVHISVIDKGIGMNESRLKSLFHFEKKDSVLGTEKETGTGLGLLICKELLEKSGEKIWVTSELGQGTSIIFSVKLI